MQLSTDNRLLLVYLIKNIEADLCATNRKKVAFSIFNQEH